MNKDWVLEMRKQTGMIHRNLKRKNSYKMQVKNIREEKKLNGKLVTNIWKAC